MSDNCLSCHGQSFSNMPTHFIEGDSDCRFCHEVPASVRNNRPLEGHAVDTFVSNALCQSCHVEIGNSNTLTKHNGFNCIECHSSHGSNNEHALIKKAVPLCSDNCHTTYELGNSHPVGNELVDKNNENELTCVSSCHSNHQPQEEKMLQLAEVDLCTTCHAEY